MKIWAVIIALAIGMALLPDFRSKSEVTSRVVVTAVGIDFMDNEKYAMAVQAIETMKTSGSLSEQEDNATKVYEIEGRSVAGAIQAFATENGRDTYILHNRLIALGMELISERELSLVLDYFMRNHESRPLVDMVVCRGKAAEVLQVPSASYPIPAEQVEKLLEEGQRWGTVAHTTLLDVERAMSGMWDAIMPIIKVDDSGEEPRLMTDGTAVFQGGTLAGELDENGTRGLLFAMDRIKECLYVLKMDDGRSVTAEIHKSNTKIKLEKDGNGGISYAFSIDCRAEITEEYGEEALNTEQLAQLNSLLTQAIKADAEYALEQTMHQFGCDPLGLRRMVMKKYPDAIRGQEDEWEQQLRSCTFTVDVDAYVDRSGMLTKSAG